MLLNDSLSILIPIHNAQSTLSEDIGRLLEVAAELTFDLDVLILDDGSTDRTEEVAWDLTMCYAQVSYIRFPEKRGLVSAIRAGLPETRGDFILVCNTEQRLTWDNLSRLWSARRSSTMSASEEKEAPRWLKRLMQWGRSLQNDKETADSPIAMRLLRRDDVSAWNQLDTAMERPYVERLRRRQAASTTPTGSSSMEPTSMEPTRLDSADKTGGPAWTSIAGHVQDFALGE